MKKVVRSVWICALSGLAFLRACCTQNGLTRKERRLLRKEREQVEMQLAKVKSDEFEIPKRMTQTTTNITGKLSWNILMKSIP